MPDQAENPVSLICTGLKFRVVFINPTGSKDLYKTALLPIFQSFLVPWLLLQSHEELSVFQINWHFSLPCAVIKPTHPLVQNRHLQALGQFRDGKDRVFTASYGTSAQRRSDLSPMPPPQSCSKKPLKHIQTFFLTISGLRVS